MNFYLATFKISPVPNGAFRLSEYFETPARPYFLPFINNGTPIPLKQPPLSHPSAPPFFTFLRILDNPCQNPIEYGQEINGMFSVIVGHRFPGGAEGRRRRTKKRVYESRGSNANCPPRRFWHPSSRKFVPFSPVLSHQINITGCKKRRGSGFATAKGDRILINIWRVPFAK